MHRPDGVGLPCVRVARRVRQSVIGEGEAFHRTSPDGDRGEKADLHSPAQFTQ
jgi:hypothetical protein